MSYPQSIFGFADPVSSWSHFLAAFASLVCGVFLMQRARGNTGRMWAVGIFAFSSVFLFSMSGVYHLFPRFGSPTRLVMQRLDHAAIWIMIAGSFTPIHYILCRGWGRWGVLAFVWIIAIIGLVLKTVFFSDIPNWMTTTLYIGLGWVGLISIQQLVTQLGVRKLLPLAVGGLAYTIGAIIDATEWPVIFKGYLQYHEIFHLMVVFAAASHWWFIYQWANHPVKDDYVVEVHERPNSEFIAQVSGEAIKVVAHSKEELKTAIRKAFAERFHQHYIPKTLRLRFVKEELV